MSGGQYKQLLQNGWEAYQHERWDELKNLLHQKIVWHEFHDGVTTGDHEGVDAVMAHFQQCKSQYGNPTGRIYHVLDGDHAVVSDQITGEPERCIDMYRIEDNLIREMWTCVNDAVAKQGGGPNH